MFRFSIRDLLWLTLVVAMGLGWWNTWRTDHTDRFKRRAASLEEALQMIGWRVEYGPADPESLAVIRKLNDSDHIRFYYGFLIGHVGVVNMDGTSPSAAMVSKATSACAAAERRSAARDGSVTARPISLWPIR